MGRCGHRKVNEQKSLKDKLTALAAEAGFSIDDVLGLSGGKGRGGKKSAVAAKYRNPDNSDETWAGRGRMPNWLGEKLKKRGVKIEDFAI